MARLSVGRRRGISGEHGGHGDGGHANHAEMEVRWLLPYADMLTLLFVLFVAMFAISAVNTSKAKALSESIGTAFNGEKPTMETPPAQSGADPSILAGASGLVAQGSALEQLRKKIEENTSPRDQVKEEIESLKRIEKDIRTYASKAGIADQVQTDINQRGLTIRLLSDKVLFASGEAQLKARAFPLIAKIGEALRRVPNDIRVEGHTDNIPISTAQFPSNWELSAMRATAVTRLLIVDGTNPRRLSAAGYAQQQPRKSNSTPTGRSSNRRVEIVVLRRQPS